MFVDSSKVHEELDTFHENNVHHYTQYIYHWEDKQTRVELLLRSDDAK